MADLEYDGPNTYDGPDYIPESGPSITYEDSEVYNVHLGYNGGDVQVIDPIGSTYDGVAVAAYFVTPKVCDEPPYLPDSTPTQIGLWRHYAPGCRGVNVFLLSDGTYVQDTATMENQNVNIPYPINFNYPGAPIVQTTNWDGTVIDTYINPYVVKQYFGGTMNPITEAEATALTAAGYGMDLIYE